MTTIFKKLRATADNFYHAIMPAFSPVSTASAKKAALAVLVATAGAGLFATAALADGGISRKASDGEKKFLEETHSRLREALPKAPQGWAGEPEAEQKFDAVDEGFGKYPAAMTVGASYSKKESEAELEAKNKASEAALSKSKSSFDAITKKQEELAAKIAKAAEKMDMKEIEKLQKEADALAKEAEKASGVLNADMRSGPVDVLKSTDAHANVEINPSALYINEPMELPKIDGCVVLREKPDNPDFDDKVKTVVLVGPWTVAKNAEGRLEAKSPYDEKSPWNKVTCAAVHIDATKDITEQLLKSLDLKKIAALIAK